MDYFATNIKLGHSDLRGYDLPKSVHNSISKYRHRKQVLNTLEQTVIKSRGIKKKL